MSFMKSIFTLYMCIANVIGGSQVDVFHSVPYSSIASHQYRCQSDVDITTADECASWCADIPGCSIFYISPQNECSVCHYKYFQSGNILRMAAASAYFTRQNPGKCI